MVEALQSWQHTDCFDSVDTAPRVQLIEDRRLGLGCGDAHRQHSSDFGKLTLAVAFIFEGGHSASHQLL